MSVVADLLVKISGDSAGLRKELGAVQRQVKDAFGGSALGASSKSLSFTKYLTAGFVGAGVAAVKFAADMEQTIMAFETLLGSGEAAESMVKDLADFAARTPFQLPGITKSTQQLLAYGFTAESVIPMLTSVGDATSGLGGTEEDMQSIIRALGQMKAKGKVSAEEVQQLAEKGINAWKYLSDAAGKSIAEVQDLSKKGALSADAAIQAILSGMDRQFKGGMEKQSQTINGLISTIKDNAVGAARTIGTSLANAFDLKDRLKGVSSFLTEFSAMAEKDGVGSAVKDMVPDSVKVGVIALASAYTGRLIPALYDVAVSSAKANASLLPLMGTTAAIGLAVAELSGMTNVLGPINSSLLSTGVAVLGTYKSINMATAAFKWFNAEIYNGYCCIGNANTIIAKMAQAFMFAQMKVISAGGAMAALRGTVVGLGASLKALSVALGPAGWLAIAVGAGYWLTMRDQMKEAEKQANITRTAIEKIDNLFADADATEIAIALDTARTHLQDLEIQAKKTTVAMIEASTAAFTSKNGVLGGAVGQAAGVFTDKEYLEKNEEIDSLKAEITRLEELYKEKKKIQDQLGKNKSGGNGTETPLIGESEDKKAKERLKKLLEKAKDTSDRIEDEWIQLTGTKMDALEKWRRDEIKTLNETKSVNENYQRDMTRLEETYAEKRRKILQDEAQEKQRIYEEITTGYSDLFATLYSGGLKGSPKDLFDMAQSARDDYKSAKDFFARINAEYENGTKKQKEDIIEALDAAGVAYKKTGQDGLDFTKSLYDYELERFRQLQDEKVDYFRQCKDIQSNIDEAYNKNSLTQLKAVLTKENALRLASYEAQRAAMDLYYDSWAAANISTSHQITNVLDDMRGSFKTLFSDLITGSQTFGETLLNFFEDLANNIVDSFAEKWSNQIVNGMMGWFDLGGEKQGGGLLGGSVLSGAAGGGGMLGGLGGIFGGGFNIGGIFGGLGETTATLNDTMGAFGDTVLSNTGDMGLLGGAVQGGAGLMRGFNGVQGMINATTKPTEAATTAAATAALSALTPAAISAAAALNSVGSSGLFGGIFGFATGGPVFGAGSATSDSIPAMLSNGEYVMNASAVDRFGLGFFNRLNNGELPALAEGGLVTGPSLSSVGVRSYAEPAGRETAGGGIGKKEAVETVAEQQLSVSMSVYAMDAKSFEGWLEDTGGKPLEKFMKSRRREFALLGG